MEDAPLTAEELSSELTGLNKGEKGLKKKQFMIILGVAIAVIVILIVIIIVASANSGPKNENAPKSTVLGEIKLSFNIDSDSKSIKILSDEFEKNSDFDILIDGKVNKYSKEIKFDSTGIHEVTFRLYNGINMDYMFKDVEDIISVEMKSEKNCEITSMIRGASDSNPT